MYRPWRFWIPSQGPLPVPGLHFGNHRLNDLSPPKGECCKLHDWMQFSMCEKTTMLGTFFRGVISGRGVSQVAEVRHCGSCQETWNKRPSGGPPSQLNFIKSVICFCLCAAALEGRSEWADWEWGRKKGRDKWMSESEAKYVWEKQKASEERLVQWYPSLELRCSGRLPRTPRNTSSGPSEREYTHTHTHTDIHLLFCSAKLQPQPSYFFFTPLLPSSIFILFHSSFNYLHLLSISLDFFAVF